MNFSWKMWYLNKHFTEIDDRTNHSYKNLTKPRATTCEMFVKASQKFDMLGKEYDKHFLE